MNAPFFKAPGSKQIMFVATEEEYEYWRDRKPENTQLQLSPSQKKVIMRCPFRLIALVSECGNFETPIVSFELGAYPEVDEKKFKTIKY